jgi:hypothetical protein
MSKRITGKENNGMIAYKSSFAAPKRNRKEKGSKKIMVWPSSGRIEVVLMACLATSMHTRGRLCLPVLQPCMCP